MTDRGLVEYLDLATIRRIYDGLYGFAAKSGEPIEPFERALMQRDTLESILSSIAHQVFGRELYPTIADKAAFLFYSIAKNHVFINGNKRMASLSVEVFLINNGYEFFATADELTAKVLEVVLSDARSHEAVKRELSTWIEDHIALKN